MLLAMNVGNSSIHLGVFDGDTLLCKSRMATIQQRTADEWAVLFRGVLENHGVSAERFTGAILSSVVPSLTKIIRDGAAMITGLTPLLVGPGIKTGLEILIDNPAVLGSDMVCTAVAAKSLYSLPVIVADFGTSTTLCVVDAKGRCLGCAIVPGVKTSLDALTAHAAQLTHIALDAPSRVIGRNTSESVRSGVLYGNASMLDGMTARIEEELGQSCTIVATGGMSADLYGLCRREILWNDTLLLTGLKILWQKNC